MCITTENIPEWFKDEAEMVLVVEMTKQTKAVKSILMVSIIQTLQKLQLFQTSLVPGKT